MLITFFYDLHKIWRDNSAIRRCWELTSFVKIGAGKPEIFFRIDVWLNLSLNLDSLWQSESKQRLVQSANHVTTKCAISTLVTCKTFLACLQLAALIQSCKFSQHYWNSLAPLIATDSYENLQQFSSYQLDRIPCCCFNPLSSSGHYMYHQFNNK
jgi:hypothetical protein